MEVRRCSIATKYAQKSVSLYHWHESWRTLKKPYFRFPEKRSANIMKKLIFTALILLNVSVAFSQRYAYVDTEYILTNLTDYQNAQKELDRISQQWQQEIEE